MLSNTILSDWKPKDKFIDENKDRIPPRTIKWLLTQRNVNGLNIAVRKIGKVIMIHEPSFVKWLEERES